MTQVISQMTYSHTRKMHKGETGKVQRGSSYLGFQVHVVLEQQLQDVYVPVLAGCLHGGVSSTLAIHLRGKGSENVATGHRLLFLIFGWETH